MKITIQLSTILFAALLSFSSISCAGKKHTKYQCPMKCEGEKTYAKPQDCPVCGMELKGVD